MNDRKTNEIHHVNLPYGRKSRKRPERTKTCRRIRPSPPTRTFQSSARQRQCLLARFHPLAWTKQQQITDDIGLEVTQTVACKCHHSPKSNYTTTSPKHKLKLCCGSLNNRTTVSPELTTQQFPQNP